MVERRHNDIWENMFNALWRGQLTPHLKMTAGLDTKVSQGKHYKTVDDLLGANQWIDVDPFAERDIADLAQNIGLTQAAIEHVKQNDTENPNRPVKEGDVFGYNYNINMYQASVFAQNEWNFHAVDFYYALKGTFSSFQREGFMENGRAVYLQRIYAQYDPANADTWKDIYTSKGKGYLATFLDPSLKAGVTYKIDGRNHLKANVLAETRAPLARNAYISQRIHDRMVDNLSSAKILSYDLSYEFNFRPVRGRITAYRTHFLNQTELNGYYDDGYRTFVNQAMTGINSIHQGVEFAAAVKMGMYFTLSAAATVSDNHYTSNAYSVTSAENGMALAVSNSGYPLYELRDSVLINGLKVANGPQLAGSLKLSFFHPKMWFADITVSYFDWNYLDFSPSRRMQGLFTGVRADGSKVNGTYTIDSLSALYTVRAGILGQLAVVQPFLSGLVGRQTNILAETPVAQHKPERKQPAQQHQYENRRLPAGTYPNQQQARNGIRRTEQHTSTTHIEQRMEIPVQVLLRMGSQLLPELDLQILTMSNC